eukprot:CAMPEP_0115426460 /NCGR_PEP_ID=MMETSP0271-20121206/28925_1 /TAXON_ID=71861 /ORGANISM="Scrippsiella trochoidea, Strain CCMP3099" /LENGTH=30 /DNA_ID= /DNA_START= /DNA_END= /DNA_ORIENTATION=
MAAIAATVHFRTGLACNVQHLSKTWHMHLY